MVLLMLCMGLTSCYDVLSVFDNPASNGENVVTPKEEVITEDQMAVTVTADLPRTLEEARKAAGDSRFLKAVLPEEIAALYVR